MNRVFVLSSTGKPLAPCHPSRARELLNKGKARIYSKEPFTIMLLLREDGATQSVELKLDPGSNTTGIALVADFQRGPTVIWAAELTHRGEAIKRALESRRSLRRTRRARKTRYRQARFNNRARPKGWLPPSLLSRVYNVSSWTNKLLKRIPITSCGIETVSFDTQKILNPEITGVEYQRGELFGYEVRQYLLRKWHRTCTYCQVKNVPLQIEHIQPISKGGSNRVSNLTIACQPCNLKKNNQTIEQFLANKPELLKRIQAQTKVSLKDAAAVNATRYKIVEVIQELGLTVSVSSGGRTKYNRVSQGYPKAHWIDAACVGESGSKVYIPKNLKPLLITATGHGTRQVVRVNKYGFPRGKAGRVKRVHGFQTGDLVRLKQPSGKYQGVYTGRLAGIRARGDFDLVTKKGKITSSYKNFTLLQRGDGYAYAR